MLQTWRGEKENFKKGKKYGYDIGYTCNLRIKTVDQSTWFGFYCISLIEDFCKRNLRKILAKVRPESHTHLIPSLDSPDMSAWEGSPGWPQGGEEFSSSAQVLMLNTNV